MASRVEVLALDPDDEQSVLFTVESQRVMNDRTFTARRQSDERKAKELWNKMSNDQRAALVSLVQAALVEMSQDVERWLQSALTATSNQTIGVSLLFQLGNLDQQIVLRKAQLDAERDERIADLQRISNGADRSPV